MLAALFVGTNCGFGVRIKQGRLERSEFDATLAAGSARLAGLKVIVRSVCALAVLIALGVSVWGSLSFIAVGKGYEPLRSGQRAIEGAVGALTGYQLVALAAVASIGFVAMGGLHAASLGDLGTLFPSREYRGIAAVALWSRARPAGAGGTKRDRIGVPAGRALRGNTLDAAAAMVLTTIYLFWRASRSGC